MALNLCAGDNIAVGKRVEDGQTKCDSKAKDKRKERGDSNRPPSKIIIRRLPPTMTEMIFRDQVSPIPDHDYLCFVKADLSLGQGAFSRAYINFLNQSDINTFKQRFDGYIFVDNLGREYPAVVEFAPSQKVPKEKVTRRQDAISGTIEEDPAYLAFLQTLKGGLKDNENKHTSAYSYQPPVKDHKKVTTPLIEFLKQRRADQQRCHDEWMEERKKKKEETEQRKMLEEERRKKKPEKEGIVAKQVRRNRVRDQDTVVKSSRFGDVKPPSDFKRHEENTPCKGKQYPESWVVSNSREKPGFRANTNSRQKAPDKRGDRRLQEDVHKKSDEEYRRRCETAKPGRYDEKEHRFNGRELWKSGGDAAVQKSFRGEAAISADVKVNEDKQSEKWPMEASKKRVGTCGHRNSRRGNVENRDTPDNFLLRKSPECLPDAFYQHKPVERFTGKEYQPEQPKPMVKNRTGRRKVESHRSRPLESGGVYGDNVKGATKGTRCPLKRNPTLGLENLGLDKNRHETEAERKEQRIRNLSPPNNETSWPALRRYSQQRMDRGRN